MATEYDNGAAKRGQAINLVVHDEAIKQKNNVKDIYSKYVYYSTNCPGVKAQRFLLLITYNNVYVL